MLFLLENTKHMEEDREVANKDMEQQIIIKYDVSTRTLTIKENDFTTFEVLGILQATKSMIFDNWLKEDE
jgi:hypothetical protein